MKHMLATKRKSVLLLGSGALKIGEAGEFDYSGSQAAKVLNEAGLRVIIVNPNVATVQTTQGMAEVIYLTPVTLDFVSRVISKERPDYILLSFGGQTALNCGLELEKAGILKKFDVSVLGTPVSVIRDTEDRGRFVKRLDEIGIKTPKSCAVTTVRDAIKMAKKIGYPVMVRSGFALGGLGSGIVKDDESLKILAERALSNSMQILIEESLYGWKELEYEVVRDSAQNCITVCNMENMDPLGVHTGESIVVAPSQTLTNDEYHFLREISIKTISHLGIIGECNIQFALHPLTADYRVIEVNARLSRSSALASKATGYPLAAVATQIALGKTLPEIANPVTRVTKACFEPALDYVAVKMPKWDTQKFRSAEKGIGSQMKSVGEVMAIGRSFEEAIQKATRMIGHDLWVGDSDTLDSEVETPSEGRIFSIANAIASKNSVEKISTLSKINPWFIKRIENIVKIGKQIMQSKALKADILRIAKKAGYSDYQIAKLHFGKSFTRNIVEKVRNLRIKHNILPAIKQIDTLAGEFPAKTNYLYLTYHGTENDVAPLSKKSVSVIGSGVYRIGQSVEFDWCAVEALRSLREKKIPSIVINFNPETVSTDYDESDRLYFDEISEERVRDILDFEKSKGVVMSMGGQTANNLVLPLSKTGVKILGTSPTNIDRAEDRNKFSVTLDELKIDQPKWSECEKEKDAIDFANKTGYPVLLRPSYVLSGAAMRVVYDEKDLKTTLKLATDVSPDHPVVISEYITRAKEIEFDGVAVNGKIRVRAISEHIEHAGVHSGDATLVFPPQRLYRETIFRIERLSEKIAREFEITGPFNIQFLAKDNWIKVIECNLRASRSFPFVSKVGGQNLARLATRALLGEKLIDIPKSTLDYKYVGVKAPQFSFGRLPGADPVSGVEMASTGEVGCIGKDVQDAFLQAQFASGFSLKKKSILISIGGERNRYDFLEAIEDLQSLGFSIYATKHTAEFLGKNHIFCTLVGKFHEKHGLNVHDLLEKNMLGLMIVVANERKPLVSQDHYELRRSAIDKCVPLFTNLQTAKLLASSLRKYSLENLSIKSLQEWSKGQ